MRSRGPAAHRYRSKQLETPVVIWSFTDAKHTIYMVSPLSPKPITFQLASEKFDLEAHRYPVDFSHLKADLAHFVNYCDFHHDESVLDLGTGLGWAPLHIQPKSSVNS